MPNQNIILIVDCDNQSELQFQKLHEALYKNKDNVPLIFLAGNS